MNIPLTQSDQLNVFASLENLNENERLEKFQDEQIKEICARVLFEQLEQAKTYPKTLDFVIKSTDNSNPTFQKVISAAKDGHTLSSVLTKESALYDAIQNQDLSTIEALILLGIQDINKPDKNGHPPIYYALKGGFSENCRSIIGHRSRSLGSCFEKWR